MEFGPNSRNVLLPRVNIAIVPYSMLRPACCPSAVALLISQKTLQQNMHEQSPTHARTQILKSAENKRNSSDNETKSLNTTGTQRPKPDQTRPVTKALPVSAK